MKPSFYAVLEADVRYDKSLSSTAKIIYAEITALTNKNGYCWATNKYFADLFDISDSQVSRIISDLSERGYIESIIEESYKRKITLRKKRKGDTQKAQTPPTQKCVYNNTSNNNKNNNNVEIQRIYDYYLKCFSVNGNKYKLTPKRASKIGARLKEFSADDIEKAIENAFRDDFYGGKKTSWKADLDYIVRSYENTEKLANLESGKMVVTYSIYNDPRYKTVDQLHPEVVLTDEERKRKLDSIAELKKNFLKGKLGGRI